MKDSLTFEDLVKQADKGYPEGELLNAFENPGDDQGDTLALVIVRELDSSFSPADTREDQILEAVRALRVVRDEINAVIDSIEELLDD